MTDINPKSFRAHIRDDILSDRRKRLRESATGPGLQLPGPVRRSGNGYIRMKAREDASPGAASTGRGPTSEKRLFHPRM